MLSSVNSLKPLVVVVVVVVVIIVGGCRSICPVVQHISSALICQHTLNVHKLPGDLATSDRRAGDSLFAREESENEETQLGR